MTELSEPSTCPFAHYDAAYVLGGLSTEDRAAFERHMDACDGCAHAVRDLAGLPGLLAHADPAPATVPPPMPELLPALSARARRERKRRTLLSASSAFVAVAACVVLVLAVLLPGGDDVDGTPMRALGDYPVQASVEVTDTPRGSRIDMSCSYAGDRDWDYALVMIPRDGSASRLARWHAVPGEPVRMSVATPVVPSAIAALEIRTPSGTPVLRLRPPG